MKWKYFAGAAIVVACALLKAGAPVISIVLGIAFVALLNVRQQRVGLSKTKPKIAR